jgi:hypothetical protein
MDLMKLSGSDVSNSDGLVELNLCPSPSPPTLQTVIFRAEKKASHSIAGFPVSETDMAYQVDASSPEDGPAEKISEEDSMTDKTLELSKLPTKTSGSSEPPGKTLEENIPAKKTLEEDNPAEKTEKGTMLT